ncbi:MAG: sulfatase [Opitutales bacterium]|nr:sulfatase [Opitutales bacterium]
MKHSCIFNVLFSLLFALGATAADRPNILLILSDDHSFPHLGAYSNVNCIENNITPNLDALAKEGMLLNRAYTPSPQCAPSRASIFAGRSPIGIAATRFAQPARSGTVFFTDLLRKSGYWVGLDGRHQHLDGRGNDLDHVSDALIQLGMRGEAFESRFDHFVQKASTKRDAVWTVDEKIEAALDKVDEGRPFFLYFGFNQPHRKWGEDHDNIDPSKLILPDDWPDLPEVRLDYARYLAEVRDLDSGMGLVEYVLEKRGLKENTIIIFMGDNGEALLRGKGTVLDRGTHVPLIVRWPGKVKAGTSSNSLISGIDLAATILEIAGVEKDPGMNGQSFLNLLLDKTHTPRDYVFAERGWHFGPIKRMDGFDLSRSVMNQKYLLIYNSIPERSYSPVDMSKNPVWLRMQALHDAGELSDIHAQLYFQNPRPIFELYDLDEDPFQLSNLAGQSSVTEIEKTLRIEMDKWMIREGDYLPLPSHAHQLMR